MIMCRVNAAAGHLTVMRLHGKWGTALCNNGTFLPRQHPDRVPSYIKPKKIVKMESKILIVGAGIFGISTAYHLAKQSSNPASITVLDRLPAPSQDAASTDVNKIIRADYSSPLYMELGLEAIEAWKNDKLFKDSGVYHQTGWIMMDEKDSDLAGRIRANFQAISGSDPLQPMSEDAVRSEWGGLLKNADLRPFGSFFFNPLAGWADAGRALTIMANEVVRMGVRYQVGEATRLVMGEGGIEGVETTSGDLYSADKVLLCTGAWTSQLMSSIEEELKISETERIESQATAAGVCVAHIQLSDGERNLYDQLPVYVYGEQGKAN
jgi:sarcosine oxidase/L-pipecolate oxidase